MKKTAFSRFSHPDLHSFPRFAALPGSNAGQVLSYCCLAWVNVVCDAPIR